MQLIHCQRKGIYHSRSGLRQSVDTLTLAASTRLGPVYDTRLGRAGGIDEVWKARDNPTRPHRTIKREKREHRGQSE